DAASSQGGSHATEVSTGRRDHALRGGPIRRRQPMDSDHTLVGYLLSGSRSDLKSCASDQVVDRSHNYVGFANRAGGQENWETRLGNTARLVTRNVHHSSVEARRYMSRSGGQYSFFR